MKNRIFAFILALLIASPAIAQVADEEPSDLDDKAKKITSRLTEDLALSEDQREEVYEITVEMLEEKMEKDDTRGEIMREYDEELAEVLNDEQYAQYMESDSRKKMMMGKKDKMHSKDKHRNKDRMKKKDHYKNKKDKRDRDRDRMDEEDEL